MYDKGNLKFSNLIFFKKVHISIAVVESLIVIDDMIYCSRHRTHYFRRIAIHVFLTYTDHFGNFWIIIY